MAIDYCSEALGNHELVNCGAWQKGGVDAIAVMETDHTITDFTSASEWNTNISSGKVEIVKQVTGELPEASDIEVDNPIGGGNPTVNDGFQWTFVVEDSNISASNDTFWEGVNKKTIYLTYRLKNSGEIGYISDPVEAIAKPIVPKNKSDLQKYMVTFKWEGREFPARYTEPSGIFDV